MKLSADELSTIRWALWEGIQVRAEFPDDKELAESAKEFKSIMGKVDSEIERRLRQFD